jgi:hypothetical protein
MKRTSKFFMPDLEKALEEKAKKFEEEKKLKSFEEVYIAKEEQ